MDSVPIDPNGLITYITEKNSLVGLELLIIICLVFVIRTLYNRNIMLGDNYSKALLDSTLAVNNNTTALNALTKEIERNNS